MLSPAEINYLTCLRDYQATRAVTTKYLLPSLKAAVVELLKVIYIKIGVKIPAAAAAVADQTAMIQVLDKFFGGGNPNEIDWDYDFTARVTTALTKLSQVVKEVKKYSL